MKYAKVKTSVPKADGATAIQHKSYHEELSSIKEETQQSIMSSRMTLLTDIIKCLDVITKDISPELDIHIITENDKVRIVKTWTVKKEIFGR